MTPIISKKIFWVNGIKDTAYEVIFTYGDRNGVELTENIFFLSRMATNNKNIPIIIPNGHKLALKASCVIPIKLIGQNPCYAIPGMGR